MTRRLVPTVLVVLRSNGIHPPGLETAAGDVADFVFARTAHEAGAAGAAADVVFVWDFRSRLVPEMLPRLPRLRWVHVSAVGVDATLSDELARSPVTLTNARGVTAPAMAEYALSLMLALAKDLRRTVDEQRSASWSPRVTRLLRGTCLVTVGVGAVNRSLAKHARCLGMRVIGVGRTARAGDDVFDRIVASSELESVLPSADYLVVATPRTRETVGLIGPSAFDALKVGALVVNVGRGDAIDEASLLGALRDGHVAGAALDVMWREPLEPGHPLWTMPNVIVSPHMASDAAGWEEAMVSFFLENLRRWLSGQPLLNVVDKVLGYTPATVDAR